MATGLPNLIIQYIKSAQNIRLPTIEVEYKTPMLILPGLPVDIMKYHGDDDTKVKFPSLTNDVQLVKYSPNEDVQLYGMNDIIIHTDNADYNIPDELSFPDLI